MFVPLTLNLFNFLSHKDTKYVFQNGRPVLFVGENLDDPSQKGNGSGKSSLIEAIHFVLFGSPLRKVNLAELIKKDEKSAMVTFYLKNSVTNQELIIIRSLKPSQELYVEFGGKEIKRSNPNEYNRFILDTIGISKEDLKSFFLITKDSYTPFLLIPDSEKKKIITRFTKSERVDQLIESFPPRLNSIDMEITKSTTKLGAIAKSIKEFDELINSNTEEQWQQGINLQVEKIEVEIESLTEEVEKLRDEMSTQQANKLSVESEEIPEFNKSEYEAKISSQEAELIVVEEGQKSILLKLNELETTYSKTITSKSSQIKEYEIVLRHLKLEEKKQNEEIAQIELLLSGEIECPACTHKFLLPNKQELTLEECQDLLQVLSSELQELKQQISEQENKISLVNKEIIDSKQELSQKEKELLSEKSSLTYTLNHITLLLNNYKKELYDKEREYKRKVNEKEDKILAFQRKIKSLSERILDLNNTITTRFTTMEELLSAQFDPSSSGSLLAQKKKDEAKRELEEETNTTAELYKLLENTKKWQTNFKSFRNYLTNKTIEHISQFSNHFLQRMGSNISIQLEGYKENSTKTVKEEITGVVYKDGFKEGSYGRFSAGERGRIDICIILTFQELINLTCPSGGLDLLCCDEVLDSVDTLGLESIFFSLSDLKKTIILVSQNEINSLSKDTVVFKKEKGETYVYNKSQMLGGD